MAARPRMRVCCAVSQDGKRRQAQVLRREGARSGGGDGAGGVARLAAATLVASPCGEVGQRQHPQHGWSSVPCGRETHRRERSRNQARPGWSRLIYAKIGAADWISGTDQVSQLIWIGQNQEVLGSSPTLGNFHYSRSLQRRWRGCMVLCMASYFLVNFRGYYLCVLLLVRRIPTPSSLRGWEYGCRRDSGASVRDDTSKENIDREREIRCTNHSA